MDSIRKSPFYKMSSPSEETTDYSSPYLGFTNFVKNENNHCYTKSEYVMRKNETIDDLKREFAHGEVVRALSTQADVQRYPTLSQDYEMEGFTDSVNYLKRHSSIVDLTPYIVGEDSSNLFNPAYLEDETRGDCSADFNNVYNLSQDGVPFIVVSDHHFVDKSNLLYVKPISSTLDQASPPDVSTSPFNFVARSFGEDRKFQCEELISEDIDGFSSGTSSVDLSPYMIDGEYSFSESSCSNSHCSEEGRITNWSNSEIILDPQNLLEMVLDDNRSTNLRTPSIEGHLYSEQKMRKGRCDGKETCSFLIILVLLIGMTVFLELYRPENFFKVICYLIIFLVVIRGVFKLFSNMFLQKD